MFSASLSEIEAMRYLAKINKNLVLSRHYDGITIRWYYNLHKVNRKGVIKNTIHSCYYQVKRRIYEH